MKTVSIPKILILFVLITGLQQAGFSQELIASQESSPNENPEQGRLVSTYREFFKWKEYESALRSWWTLFHDFPGSSERLYVDGVTMYRHFIGKTPDGQARNAKIDTLMLIYDQRMAYFGGAGNILGRKGTDLLRYRSDDTERVKDAYGMLKKSREIEGAGSREAVMLNFMASGFVLLHAGMLDNNQVMEDYFLVTGLLDQQEGRGPRWERTRASIDEMIKKDGILSCEGLDHHFRPQFEQNSGDAVLLEKMVHSYMFAGCSESDLYIAAAEKLYQIDPGPETAHQLAVLFIGRNNLEKASWYLQMAVLGENLPDETRAEWYYELSIVNLANGNHCEAINYAREAKAYKNDFGKAYMALGDAFIACRKHLGDDFQQQTAFWAAADMYQLASEVDSTLAEESSEKLAVCIAQFPGAEDIFFQDLQVGKSYRVGGCIQENTTVRSSD
jgi:hypothetical protein